MNNGLIFSRWELLFAVLKRKRAERHCVCVVCIFLCKKQKADILLCDRDEVGEGKRVCCMYMYVCVLRQTSTLGQYVID